MILGTRLLAGTTPTNARAASAAQPVAAQTAATVAVASAPAMIRDFD
ncbi:MAG: hypothetical protein ACK40O_14005 [Allosphingosinicella sp.]